MPAGALLKSCPALGDWASPKPTGPSFLDLIACLLATDCLGDLHTLPSALQGQASIGSRSSSHMASRGLPLGQGTPTPGLLAITLTG